MPRGTKGPIESYQTRVRKILAKVDGTGTAAILRGKEEFSLTDQGTGDYLLTLKKSGRRFLGVNFATITAGIRFEVGTIVEGVSVQVKTFAYNSGTATDADFFCELTVADSAIET